MLLSNKMTVISGLKITCGIGIKMINLAPVLFENMTVTIMDIITKCS
jgi:hypothetical protein